MQVDSDRILGASGSPNDPQRTLVALEDNLLAGDVSRQTHDTIAAQMNDPKANEVKTNQPQSGKPSRPPNLSAIEGLLLGSPEFQRR